LLRQRVTPTVSVAAKAYSIRVKSHVIIFSFWPVFAAFSGRSETPENCGKQMRLGVRADKTADKNLGLDCALSQLDVISSIPARHNDRQALDSLLRTRGEFAER
jgi:hypothetical protein